MAPAFRPVHSSKSGGRLLGVAATLPGLRTWKLDRDLPGDVKLVSLIRSPLDRHGWLLRKPCLLPAALRQPPGVLLKSHLASWPSN